MGTKKQMMDRKIAEAKAKGLNVYVATIPQTWALEPTPKMEGDCEAVEVTADDWRKAVEWSKQPSE